MLNSASVHQTTLDRRVNSVHQDTIDRNRDRILEPAFRANATIELTFAIPIPDPATYVFLRGSQQHLRVKCSHEFSIVLIYS
jgi:hypothetical protein